LCLCAILVLAFKIERRKLKLTSSSHKSIKGPSTQRLIDITVITMKMNGKILLLCVVQASLLGTSAFVAEAPKSQRTSALSPAFSYLGSLGGRGEESSTNMKVGTVNGPTEKVTPMKTNSPAEAVS
jgi:hypothetical protein